MTVSIAKILPVVALCALFGCETHPPCICVRVLRVEPHHSTRAFVTVQCEGGWTWRDTEHWSRDVVCKENSIRVGDYIPGYGTKPFGNVP